MPFPSDFEPGTPPVTEEPEYTFMQSRYEGRCSECRARISEGDNIFWKPGTVYCEPCGEAIGAGD